MKDHFFWNDFYKKDKILYLFILALAVLAGLALFVYAILGTQHAYQWDILSELEEIPTVLDTFSSSGLRFNINGYAFIVKEHFLAGAMPFLAWLNPLFIAMLSIAFAILLAGVSTLKQFWFLIGSGLFSLIFVCFQLEIPAVPIPYFGFSVLFIVLIGTAFFINAFRQYFPVWKRFVIFLLEIILIISILWFYSAKNNLFIGHASVAYGMLAFIVLSCIFIFMVSHEIMALLVWMVTRNPERDKSQVPKFMLISGFYLLNLLLIYFKTSKTFGNWDGLFISPMMLLLVSGIIGIFYFKKWCDGTNLLRFESAGAWLYIGLALVTFATILYAYVSGNDALTDFFDDFTIFAHLGLGVAFVFHVLVNFIQPLQKGLEVHKVLYKPLFSSLIIARMAAVAIVGLFLFSKHNFSLSQATAGYFNAIGDYQRTAGNTQAAQKFYSDGLNQDQFNHHGNYANGTIAWLTDDKSMALYYFKQASRRDASEQAFAATSRYYQENDKYFDAIFALKEGLKKFPESGPLQTNLAMLLDKTNVADSVFFYLNQANNGSKPVYASNMLAFWMKYGKESELRSITEKAKNIENASYQANLTALQNRVNLPLSATKSVLSKQDSALNVSNFALIFNRNVSIKPADKTDFVALQNHPQNGPYAEDLQFARACRAYYGAEKIKGIETLRPLTRDSTKVGVLSRRTLGIWLLQEGVYDAATTLMAASGDAASVAVLNKQDFKTQLLSVQQAQAEVLLKNAKTKADFDAALQKAPLNPTIVGRVGQFYSEKLKDNKTAYDFVSAALFNNPDAPEILKTHAIIALRLGLTEYAEGSLMQLKGKDFDTFSKIFEDERSKLTSEFK